MIHITISQNQNEMLGVATFLYALCNDGLIYKLDTTISLCNVCMPKTMIYECLII